MAVKRNDFTELNKLCKSVKVCRINLFDIGLNVSRSFFGNMPLQSAYFYDSGIKNKILKYGKEIAPDVIVCMLTRMSRYAASFTGIPKLLDYQDAFSKGVERRLAHEGFFLRTVLNHETQRQAQHEKDVFDLFDEKIIISSQDRALIQHPMNNSIHIIPNGVDYEYFSPHPVEKKYDLVFTGNMNYPSNIESAVYIVKEILPHVRKKYPQVKLLIAGAHPAARVRSLQSETVHVSGWMDDIRESYLSAKMLVAPMLINIGQQNKILEAMAMQIPCITSPLANNAIDATDGENIFLASSPHQYAEKIIALLEDPLLAHSIAEKGNMFVKKNYTWEKSISQLENILFRLVNGGVD